MKPDPIMKTVYYLSSVATVVAALSVTFSARAAEQEIATASKMAVAPKAAIEQWRTVTVAGGNAGSLTFLIPAVQQTFFKKASAAPAEKWRPVAFECGNGGSATFLIPSARPASIERNSTAQADHTPQVHGGQQDVRKQSVIRYPVAERQDFNPSAVK